MDGGRECREFELDLTGVAGIEVAVGPPEPSPPDEDRKAMSVSMEGGIFSKTRLAHLSSYLYQVLVDRKLTEIGMGYLLPFVIVILDKKDR